MKRDENQRKRRSQRDYSLAFKLAVVSEVEKGQLTYKQAQLSMVFKAQAQFWYVARKIRIIKRHIIFQDQKIKYNIRFK